MKRSYYTFLALILVSAYLQACGGGSSSSDSEGLSCSDVSGNYVGTVSDNCAGRNVTSDIGVNVNSDCTFVANSSSGITTNGSLTAQNGNNYQGNATNNSGCGSFDMNCSVNMPSFTCNYLYSNGASGKISATRK